MSLYREAWELLRPTFQPTIDQYLAEGGAGLATDDELAFLLFGTLYIRLSPVYIGWQLRHAFPMPRKIRIEMAEWYLGQLEGGADPRICRIWVHAMLQPYEVAMHHVHPEAELGFLEREDVDDEVYDGPEMVGPHGILADESTNRSVKRRR